MKSINWKERLSNPFSIEIGNIVPHIINKADWDGLTIVWCKISRIKKTPQETQVWGYWFKDKECTIPRWSFTSNDAWIIEKELLESIKTYINEGYR